MSDLSPAHKLTARERLTAATLRWSPWLAFLLITFPLPLYFLLRSFTVTQEPGVYILLALSSLAIGSLVGLLVALALVFLRRRWLKQLRDRLAADGVTADELSWFKSELTPAERRTLKQMERQHPLLADAYRETLAARVTATRVLASSRREAVAVERRLRRAEAMQTPGRASLLRELQDDRGRLARVSREASEQQAEIQTRLQTIEALAGRDISEAETERALRRLGSMREYEPLGLTAARLERDARAETEEELRRQEKPGNKQLP